MRDDAVSGVTSNPDHLPQRYLRRRRIRANQGRTRIEPVANGHSPNMKPLFRRMASRAPFVAGSPWAFFTALGATIAWIASGPFFHWSGGWVLWPATLTSVGAFLLVLLLQYTQNRDTRALQLKLDELIRSLDHARTQLVRLERMSDEELEQIEEEFEELRDQQDAA